MKTDKSKDNKNVPLPEKPEGAMPLTSAQDSEEYTLHPIAHIRTDFPKKFGIPRQSGLVRELSGKIVFTPKYRNPDYIRGLSDFSHIWVLWAFSDNKAKGEPSATVRPPRLGGNTRVGVFATRSPFRPNPIGLSVLRLDSVEQTEKEGTVLCVRGADMLSGTPIFDIKPYIPFADSIPDAKGGFADEHRDDALCVLDPTGALAKLPAELAATLHGILEGDPRPAYHDDPERVYGFAFRSFEVKFRVDGKNLFLESITESITESIEETAPEK